MKKTLMAAMTSLILMNGSAYSADFGYGDCCDDGALYQGGTFYAQGDWLWWKLRRCELDFALPAIFTPGPFNPFGPTKYLQVHPEYTSGWRVAAGYETCGGYDLRVRYTQYDTHRDRLVLSPLVGLIPTRSFLSLGPVNRIDVRYNFDYDNVDIELGSVTRDCGNSYTRFFLGAQLAFIEERFDIAYGDVVPYIVHNHLDLNAYGLRAGFEYHRDLGYCLGLFVNGSASLLTGCYDIHLEENAQNVTIVNLHEHPTCFLGQFTLAAGLEYLLYKGCYGFATLSFGYELQDWVNTHDFITLHAIFSEGLELAKPNRNHSSLGTDGIVLRLTAGY